MLTELCQELKNWFDTERHFDTFKIEDGELSVDFLQDGQYYRIVGSVFNDGVYQFHIPVTEETQEPESSQEPGEPSEDPENETQEAQDASEETPKLIDETFEGAVWAMAVPPAVLALLAEIEAWQEKYGGVDSAAMSPFTSESFGGYSYSKGSRGSSSSSGTGDAGTWQSVFSSRLNKWRKIRS